MGRTTVVEEVELLKEKGLETACGGVVGGGAAHDANSDNYDANWESSSLDVLVP